MTENSNDTPVNEVIDILKTDNDGDQKITSLDDFFKGYDEEDLKASMDI